MFQGRSLQSMDVFFEPTFNKEEVSNHDNLETHFIDSSVLISWNMLKKNLDYKFVEWSFKGTTKEECSMLLNILTKQNKEVYRADYNALNIYIRRIIAPKMSEIYPVEDLLLAIIIWVHIYVHRYFSY